LIVPAGTPKEIIARLHTEVVAVMNLSEVRERLLGAGVEPLVNTPAEFAAYIDAETARYAKVVRESGARID
jgi:tripartite-type tricarboxylate transporter receptor subunit TctC